MNAPLHEPYLRRLAHRWLVEYNPLYFFSAALTLLLFGVRAFRPGLAGLAVGVAAYLASTAVLGGVHSPMGRFGFALFAGVNAVLCLLLARLVLRERSA